MKLYAVRHEKRFSSPVFATELTNQGKADTINLAEQIKLINPDYIYVSPFVRTLQTIQYYCQKYNQKVIVSNGLIESLWDPQHKKIHHAIPKEFDSIIEYIDTTEYEIQLQENSAQVMTRIKHFLKNIEKKHVGETVLCVTHMSPLEKILIVKNIKFKFKDIKMGKLWGPIIF